MLISEIKEHLSRNQFKTVANRCGYKCSTPGDGDHGVDFDVKEVEIQQRPQGNREFETGRAIQIQLKATTEAGVEFENDVVKFDLESKNYNDLIRRREGDYPLYLVLVVLPIDEASWLLTNDDHIAQHTKLYWYRPEVGAAETNNANTIRIRIPIAQRVNLDFLRNIFEEAFS